MLHHINKREIQQIKDGNIDDIFLGGDDTASCLKTDARANDVCAISVIDGWLDEKDTHTAFLIIEFCNQCLSRFR